MPCLSEMIFYAGEFVHEDGSCGGALSPGRGHPIAFRDIGPPSLSSKGWSALWGPRGGVDGINAKTGVKFVRSPGLWLVSSHFYASDLPAKKGDKWDPPVWKHLETCSFRNINFHPSGLHVDREFLEGAMRGEGEWFLA